MGKGPAPAVARCQGRVWQESGSYQKVAITGLELDVAVGAFAHERGHTTRISVDVELYRADIAYEGGGLDSCIDYDRVWHYLNDTWPGRAHVDLLEELAEELVDFCLKDRRISSCRVVLRKPLVYGGRGVPSLEVGRIRALEND